MGSGNHVCSLIQIHTALLPKIIKVKNMQNYVSANVDGCLSLSVIWVTSVGALNVVCGWHGRLEKIQGFGGGP
jgi:hypothetical protein